jgi:glycerol transport system ATP-binding protein
VKSAAALLRLEPYLDRKPLKLSGGQQQRTALARAFVKNAELVLLDEPLANLDYKLREELREELPRIFAESGAIFVYATTEPSEALLLGGNTATLFQGKVTQFGPTAQVYRQPDDLVTAQVFSDPPLNTLSGTKQAARSGSRPARASRRPGLSPACRWRLHDRLPRPSSRARRAAGACDRSASERLGLRDHRLGILCPSRCRRAPSGRAGAGRAPAGTGAGVTAWLDPARIFLFDAAGGLAAAAPAKAA